MWKKGNLKVYGDIFYYQIKVYEGRSLFGIDGGKVSKLTFKRNGATVAHYDRGWDIKPVDPDAQLAVELLLHNENW